MQRKHPEAECERCPLYSRGKFVPSYIPANNNGIVIVGEAPGRDEVHSGEPFTGISGRVLDTLIRFNGIDRESTTLTNTVLCRPPGNDTPDEETISACRGRLQTEIKEAGPEVILALGNTAASAVLGRKTKITQDRVGPPKQSELYPGISIIPTIHPAACLRAHDHFPNLVTDVAKINRIGSLTTWQKPEWKDYNTASEALSVISALEKYDELVLDIETGTDKDGEGGHPTRLRCVGFAYAKGKAVVLGEDCLKDTRVRVALRKLIGSKKLICQNGKFDLSVLTMMELAPQGTKLYYDTMLASYCLDERSGVHSLDHMGQELLGTPDWKSVIKDNGGYDGCPADILHEYNAYDVAVTYDLYELQSDLLSQPDNAGLLTLHDMLVRVSNALMVVEAEGMAVSVERLKELDVEFSAEKDQFAKEINDHLGLPPVVKLKGRKGAKYEVEEFQFNPASPKQVKERLKAHYGVSVKDTGEDTLLFLAEKHKSRDQLITFIELLLSHRKVSKMHGTYVKGVLKRQAVAAPGKVDPGRILIHPTFKIHGTTTGRLSCTNPNVQNWPRGDKMRSIYVPHKDDSVFIQADYSNAEGRIVAVLSRSETLAALFRDGRDVHGETATHFFGPDWTKEQRVKAKGIVHGLNYGRTAHGIAGDPEFGVTVDEAEELIAKYWELAPEVANWHDEVREKVFVRSEDLVSVFCRRRRFMLITPDNEHDIFKEALAWEPQSTASDINLMAAIQLREEGFKVRNIVHDSILTEAPRDSAKEMAEHMIYVMERTAKELFTDKVGFYIPFVCEYEIGNNWAEV